MLRELRIENLLLIERAELRFGPGLNVITGETGAGKTILAHSLDLLLGGRPRSAVVRPGCDEAWVEGTFELPAAIAAAPELAELAERLPAGEEVTLARRVNASSGRSSAFIAGRSASAADLRALGSRVLGFYGQHEHRKLMLAAAGAEVLDGFAGAAHLELRDRYREAHAEATRLGREIEQLEAREGARERDIDLLRFELDEIEATALAPGERDELIAVRERLRHAEGLREGAATALGALAGREEGGGAAAAAAEAAAALTRSAGVDPALDALAARGEALGLEISDLAAELRAYAEQLESDPAALEATEERLEVIQRLLRKHGGSVESVLEHAAACRERLDALEHASERRAELDEGLRRAQGERARLASELSAGRAEAAPRLEADVADALAELAMDGARIEVALEPHRDGLAASGAEGVELRVATNPGMPLAPLRDSASGGELSRVMLALAGLGPAGEASALVFDEIDAGVGGQVARRVGERLRGLGDDRQVICITHLAQVAALGSTHFRVRKESDAGTTTAKVVAVSGPEQHAEIVRMLGAEEGDEAAGRHARELLAA